MRRLRVREDVMVKWSCEEEARRRERQRVAQETKCREGMGKVKREGRSVGQNIAEEDGGCGKESENKEGLNGVWGCV